MAKKITLVLLMVMFVLGCIGPFISVFAMADYVMFLKAYAPLFISLIASIGVNSYKEKDNKENKCVDKD